MGDERVEVVLGIQCMVRREKFPDGRYRDVYRFTVPGWPECSTTGIRSAKRVIHGRLDPAVRGEALDLTQFAALADALCQLERG